MKAFLILAFLAFPILASAKTFTLVDESTKEKFICTSAAPVPAPEEKAKAESPDCTTQLTELCKAKEGQSNASCFALAGRKCKDARAGFYACVKSTQQSCVDSSLGSASTCFDRALRECK
ncbi:MAG: hypothetical protein ACXVBE_07675 [Bdellovibrionota bacterium]